MCLTGHIILVTLFILLLGPDRCSSAGVRPDLLRHQCHAHPAASLPRLLPRMNELHARMHAQMLEGYTKQAIISPCETGRNYMKFSYFHLYAN